VNDQERQAVLEELSAILGQIGLGWVTHQVLETIRAGQVVEKKMNTVAQETAQFAFPTSLGITSEVTGGKKATLPQVIDYSESEKLRWLIAGIEQTVINLWEIEEATCKIFKELNAPVHITFINEFAPISAVEFDLQEAAHQGPKLEKLRSLLCELREAINAS